MPLVPFPAFEPDKSLYNTGVVPEVVNVLPKADGWGPMPSFAQFVQGYEIYVDTGSNIYSAADDTIIYVSGLDGSDVTGIVNLPGTCFGATYARTSAGERVIVAGTRTKLYTYDSSTLSWDNASGASAPYSAEETNRWSFAVFGAYLYAQNGIDPEQRLQIGVDTEFSDTPETITGYPAPSAKYLAVVGDFLVRACLEDDPTKVQWSALNDPTSNMPGGRDFSDEQSLADGGEITGIVPVSSGAIIFCRTAIWAMSFTYDSYVFSFKAVTKYRGARAPYSVLSIGQDDFVYYSADGFFRGVNQTPIGAERVDKWFLSQTDEESRARMVAAADYANKIAWFRFMAADGTYKMLGYNWQLDRWTYSNENVSAMFASETFGVTWDGLANLYLNINQVDEPFDSSAFDGGTHVLGGISYEGFFVQLSGSNLAATVETNEISFNETSRAVVNGGRMSSDANDYTVQLITKDFKGGTERARDPISPTSRTKRLSLRGDGRLHKLKAEIASGDDWSIAHGVDVEVVGAGRL